MRPSSIGLVRRTMARDAAQMGATRRLHGPISESLSGRFGCLASSSRSIVYGARVRLVARPRGCFPRARGDDGVFEEHHGNPAEDTTTKPPSPTKPTREAQGIIGFAEPFTGPHTEGSLSSGRGPCRRGRCGRSDSGPTSRGPESRASTLRASRAIGCATYPPKRTPDARAMAIDSRCDEREQPLAGASTTLVEQREAAVDREPRQHRDDGGDHHHQWWDLGTPGQAVADQPDEDRGDRGRPSLGDALPRDGPCDHHRHRADHRDR